MQNNSKKIIVLVLNIIALVGNIGTIMLLGAINLLTKFSEIIPELAEITESLSNSNISFLQQFIILSICIIISIINLILCRKYEKNEYKIAFYMTITTMMGSIYNIIAGFVCLIAIFKRNKEEKKAENKPKEKVKLLVKFIYLVLFVAIFIVFYTEIVANNLLNLNVWLIIAIFYGGRVIIAILPFLITLKKDFKDFLENRKEYIKEIVKAFGITVLFYVPITIIVSLIIGEDSTNQSLIKEIPFWITAILAIIVAPISEEILFRGFLRKIFRNDIVFIVISGIIFGIIHCMYKEDNLLMYLYILPYTIMGAGFAKLYTKTNNIFSNILMHFVWNSMALISMAIVSIG